MFSKALFKQSCKANGLMWIIITVAICFMLSCVMLISGSGNIGKVKNSIEDTIITGEIDALMEKKAISYYSASRSGMVYFDEYYPENYKSDCNTLTSFQPTFDSWALSKPNESSFGTNAEYTNALVTWNNNMPSLDSIAKKVYADSFNTWSSQVPTDKSDLVKYQKEYLAWASNKPSVSNVAAKSSYLSTTIGLEKYALKMVGIENSEAFFDANYTVITDNLTIDQKEGFAAVMIGVNPNGAFTSEYFEKNNLETSDYDVQSLLVHLASNDLETYVNSEDRNSYLSERSSVNASIYLSTNMSSIASVNEILEALSKYGVTPEKYETFGYTFTSINQKARLTTINYQGQYDYEADNLKSSLLKGEISNEEYKLKMEEMNTKLTNDIAGSLLSSLPTEVSDALEEVGQIDLYSLIVGSIFFKMAGLLLPIIYTIMASNNLVSSQVDTGSMAYVLSTGTKRRTVVFTQAVYLVGSLLAMFMMSMLTSFICLAIVDLPDVTLTYGKLALINLGAFLVLFAISGINYFTSCTYDRSKRSMAIGGGLSIFFLVATILGLFGSPVIPSVIRLDALNMFNYVSIISLFDVVSIIDGTTVFVWKLFILLGIGLVTYIAGSELFVKKDLPL